MNPLCPSSALAQVAENTIRQRGQTAMLVMQYRTEHS